MTDTTVSPTTAGLRQWLVDRALPLWLAHGQDQAAGGFHEHLHADSLRCTADFRRLRVAARQSYVFAQAHVLGVTGADTAVALGIDFISRHAALAGGGYGSLFDLTNRANGTTRDLYDQDFVLLALASAAAVLPVAPLRRQALELLAYIDSAFAHPTGGYQESVPPRLPRRQNPHMHLLEALLAAQAAFGDAVFLDRARAVVMLFATRLFDAASGALPEQFDNGLTPLREGGSFGVEPGHHCEWVWLLHWYQRVAGPDAKLQDALQALIGHVDRHGLHPATGDVIDAVQGDGGAPVLTSRLWPQTERLKAAFLRGDSTAAHQQAALARLAAWLRPDGLWVERRDAAGQPVPGPVPASSLYHLTAAILAVCPPG